MCRSMTMKASLAQNNIERFRQRIQDKTLLAADFGASVADLQHVPQQFLRRADCRANLRNLSDDLRDIANILRVSEQWEEDEGGDTREARARQVAQVIGLWPVPQRNWASFKLKKVLSSSVISNSALRRANQIHDFTIFSGRYFKL